MTELEKVQYRHDEYKIAVHYGLADQLKQLKEELQEAMEATEDYEINPSIERFKHLNEEIADVENKTFQIKMLLERLQTAYRWITALSVCRHP
ncbi:hypothetical protein SDC9_147901 [bioreactor metagenome]|uniref:Uncharacterized protein n=1 Tax=bioreactor metagenome TaxID=1076179 RepID=A0A645EF86_9ZZZZ|nr:hypothetical protein [Candidatus Metalachnospira sp.]